MTLNLDTYIFKSNEMKESPRPLRAGRPGCVFTGHLKDKQSSLFSFWETCILETGAPVKCSNNLFIV